MKPVYVFLAPGFEEIEAITILDVLRRANVPVISVSIAGDLYVTGAHGITIAADKLYPQVDFMDADMLVLPGGMPGTTNLNVHEGLKSVLTEFVDQNKPVAALCAAPLILGQLGLLNGKKATCYPGNESLLEGAIISTNAVVQDGNIITGNGPGAAIDFSLKIVQHILGKDTSDALAQAMKHSPNKYV